MKSVSEAIKAVGRAAGLRRSHAAFARLYLERHGLATRRKNLKMGGRILCYHSVGQPEMGINDVKPAQFRRHIETALAAGFQFVPAADIANGAGDPRHLAITFDDGLRSVQTQAAPILKGFGIPWSLFVVSQWAEHRHPFGGDFALTWRELDKLAAGGVDLGSHSATHPDFGTIETSQMVEELEGSRTMFENRLGFRPTAFAIPLGQSANWPQSANDAARNAGYDIVYAQAEETRPAGTIARTFVTKFDHGRTFKALLRGAYDRWEEWY